MSASRQQDSATASLVGWRGLGALIKAGIASASPSFE